MIAWLALGERAAAQTPASPPVVLISFDVEKPGDFARVKTYALGIPLTHFVQGSLAASEPEAARALANAGDTVGSHTHTHADLTTLSDRELKAELKTSFATHEEIFGVAPRWFRAPFLSVTEREALAVADAGFMFDSSRTISQPIFSAAPTLSISTLNGVAASDFELFGSAKMGTQQAAAWLIDLYEQNKRRGHVTNILFHPSIIEPHIQALKTFIAHARADGALFLSYDSYLDRERARPISHVGAWVELFWDNYTPEKILEDAKRLKLTDVYLAAVSPEGEVYFQPTGPGPDRFGEAVKTLRAAGLRVHAWLPALRNDRLAKANPEWAMRRWGGDGTASGWLSPHHPAVRRHVAQTAAALVTAYDIQGVNLDYVRYPGREYDFSPFALRQFAAEADDPARQRPFNDWAVTGRDGTPVWVSWELFRERAIASLVRDVRQSISAASRRPVVLSAAVIADSVAPPGTANFGQNYTLLAEHLDVIMPMAYAEQENEDASWVSLITLQSRQRLANTKLLMGLGAWQEPGSWTLTPQAFRAQLNAAKFGADGVVFYGLPHAARQEGSKFGVSPDIADTIATDATTPPEPLSQRRSSGWEPRFSSLLGDENRFFSVLIIGYGLLGVAGATAFGLLHLLDGKPPPQNAASTSIPVAASHHAIADTNLARRFTEIDSLCETGRVPGVVFAEVRELLREETAFSIESQRLLAVLTVLGQSQSASVNQVLSELRDHLGGRHLAQTYLEEAKLYGLVALESGNARLTARGRARLKAGAYDAGRAAFVERRLHERLIAECPRCATPNVAQWRHEKMTCRKCQAKFPPEAAQEIAVSRVGLGSVGFV